MKKTFSRHLHIWTLALLITGTTVGAGILGLPIKTGLSGLIPSILGITVVWLLMLFTGWILVSRIVNFHHATSDLATLFYNELGSAGKWLAAAGYLVVFYGMIVAYLAGGASILFKLVPLPIPQQVWLVIFFIAATSMTLFGVDLVRKWNAVIMVILALSFVFLLILAGMHVDTSRFKYSDWEFLPSAVPIIICAFTFHNILPSVCRSLEWNIRSIRKAMVIGTLIPLLMSILWIAVVIGALPLNGQSGHSLLSAFHKNLPATVPLSLALNSNLVTTVGIVFAFTAILTSYLAVGISLTGFIRDITAPYFHNSNRVRDACLTFGLPLAVALLYPNIFLKALDVAGGIGIMLVFGILPSLILIKTGKGKSIWQQAGGYFLLLLFGCFLVLEFAQELGLLHLNPHVEYWHSNRAR